MLLSPKDVAARFLRFVDRIIRSPAFRAVIGFGLVIEGTLVSQMPGREVPGLLVALFGLWLAFSAWRDAA